MNTMETWKMFPEATLTDSVLLQEVERGARVEEEDMARLIEQLEGRISIEVRAPSNYEAIKK